MHVEPLPKKHKPVSLTPLVDVIFLLLLFFMLSSTFTQFGQVEIGAPAAGGGSDELPKAILVVEPDRLRLNGAAITKDQIKDRAESLVDGGKNSLLVFVKGASTTQELVTIMTELRSVDGLLVSVAGPR